jgi:GNAT superfamily N-acetyltransferase
MWTVYRHTKGMLYVKIATALHSESCEPMEVYRTLYNNDMAPVWVRPQGMFHEDVKPGQPRFTRVGTLRVAAPEDMTSCISCGFDVWGEGIPFEQYVEWYLNTKNHIRGTRYLFETPSGEVVASLNTIRFARGLIGIASVAVMPSARGQGYGSLIVRGVMELLRCEDSEMRFMLFSEVQPAIYERLGFQRLPGEFQFHLPSIAMITGDGPVTEREIQFYREYF